MVQILTANHGVAKGTDDADGNGRPGSCAPVHWESRCASGFTSEDRESRSPTRAPDADTGHGSGPRQGAGRR